MYDVERSAKRAERAVVACSVSTIAYAVVPFVVRAEVALLLAIVPGLLWLLAGIRWLQWFRPAYRVVIDAGRARYANWMSFWGWIIPGLTAFMPKWLAEDVWRAPDPVGYNTPLPKPVKTWWQLWCIGSLISLVVRGTSVLSFVPFALLLVSTPSAVRTIRILTERVVLLQHRQIAGAVPHATV